MKLKITEPGYINSFTGVIGGIEFVKSVSVDHVSDSDARLLASLLHVVCEEDGIDPGDLTRYSAALDNAAPHVTYQTQAEIEALNPQVEEVDFFAPNDVIQPSYSRAQLETIADKSGIAGLREISEPLGIKSTSVKRLIDLILATHAAPVAGFIEGVDPVVETEKEVVEG